ncbi:hypothetical protein KP509_25G055200 [Ceratopteris richardii]|uniref:Uncharacterized protein n=1 Tax=Ceratopteris richardii TaxID=49495 RepID=A0A8T2RT87_CERRI|nr:hypothetical protein KP509_25G055200 [Ceratopteris richardii]
MFQLAMSCCAGTTASRAVALNVCNGEELHMEHPSRRSTKSVFFSRTWRLNLRENRTCLLKLAIGNSGWQICKLKARLSTADFNGGFANSPDSKDGKDDSREILLSSGKSLQEEAILESSELSTSDVKDFLVETEDLLEQGRFGRKGYKNRFLVLAKLSTTIKKHLELFFKSEIRQRALMTILMLIAIRAGQFIPLPGYDRRFMPGDYLAYPSAAGEGISDAGSEMRLSLFQLGIGPYMGASIIMQVLCYIIPQLVQLRKEGSEGVKRIKQYTERLAFAIAVVQAFIISIQSLPYSVYGAESRSKFLLTSTSLLSLGAVLINWICNQITDSGFGNSSACPVCVKAIY